MIKEHMNIVIVGHVDHGKSTLIGRLLYDTNSLPEEKMQELKVASEALGKEIEFGFILDNLEEEREQGITIDTAQKFFKTKKREYTIIDAPGHVEFLKNMITGASQAEAAILLIDAEEGIKEQTKRHSYILGMLGIKQVMVAINKIDLVDYSKEKFEEIKKEIQEFLLKLNISPREIIPISAKNGDNVVNKSEKMNWYSGKTILEALDEFEVSKPDYEKPLRYSVQAVYNLDKRIFAGKIISGIIKKGEEIIVLPSKEKTKVKNIELFNDNREEAIAGENIGITSEDKLFIESGNIIVKGGSELPKITNRIKANIFWIDKQEYKKGDRLKFRCSTQETSCEIEEIKKKINSSNLEDIKENEKIENREVAEVIIKTDKPIIIEKFNFIPELGRFVLEREDTVAGGIII